MKRTRTEGTMRKRGRTRKRRQKGGNGRGSIGKNRGVKGDITKRWDREGKEGNSKEGLEELEID